MTTALATNDNLLVELGIIPAPRGGDSSAGRVKFQRGRFILVDYDPDAKTNNETDLGTVMRAVILPQIAYENGTRRPRLAHEFYQSFRRDQNAVCRSYVQILKPEDTQSEADRKRGYAGPDRAIVNDCEQCILGAYGPDGKWRRIKDQAALPKDEQPCKWRGEMRIIPDGYEGARTLALSYTSLQQIRGDFRDHRKGTVPNQPTLAAYLEARPEYARAFVEGRLICEFGSVLAKSDNRMIGSYEVMIVKPIGVLDAPIALPTEPPAAVEVVGAAPWDND